MAGEGIEPPTREKGKRPSYVADLRKRWKRFERWLPAERRKAINSIAQVDVRRFLDSCNFSPKIEMVETVETSMYRNMFGIINGSVMKRKIWRDEAPSKPSNN